MLIDLYLDENVWDIVYKISLYGIKIQSDMINYYTVLVTL